MRQIATLIACLAVSAPAFAAVTAYVPTCCNSISTVSVIGTAQNRVTGSFNAGQGAYAVAFGANPLIAWIADAAGKAVTVVALPGGSTIATIPLPLQPWSIRVSPDGLTVYVVIGNFTHNLEHWPARLIGIDTRTGAVTAGVAIPNDGQANPGLAISPDSKRIYATLDSKSIVVWDAPSSSLAATWTTTPALTWTASGTLTLSPDGTTLYTSGQVLSAIDTATGNQIGTVTPPGFASEFSFVGSAITADGSVLYASYASQIGTGSGLAAIDTATLAITNSAGLGGELQQPVLTADGATLYVPDAVSSLLLVVNPSTLATSGSIALTGSIATATLGPHGQGLFVPNQSTSGVLAVDPLTLQVIAKMTVASQPTFAVSAKNGARIYVAGTLSNSVSDISSILNRVTRSFTVGEFTPSVTGDNPDVMAATPDGRQLYIGGNYYEGEFAEIDVATGKLTGVGCPYGLCNAASMAVAPDSGKVYIAGTVYTLEFPVPPFFLAVDTTSKRVVKKMRPASVGAMAVAPSGAYLYLAAGPSISVYDTATDTFTGSVAASGVTSIAFTPDGSRAYCSAGNSVLVIDTAAGTVLTSISLSPAAAGPISASPDGTQVWVALAGSTSVAVIDTSNNLFQTVDLGASVNGVAFGVH